MSETTFHPLDDPATDPFAVAADAAADIARLTGVERHDIALTLGSGWGKAADLIGETTADQLERTARDDVVARQFGGDCEAAFYVGAVAERRSDRAAARASYRRAQQLCHHGMYERWAADAELRRLGQ